MPVDPSSPCPRLAQTTWDACQHSPWNSCTCSPDFSSVQEASEELSVCHWETNGCRNPCAYAQPGVKQPGNLQTLCAGVPSVNGSPPTGGGRPHRAAPASGTGWEGRFPRERGSQAVKGLGRWGAGMGCHPGGGRISPDPSQPRSHPACGLQRPLVSTQHRSLWVPPSSTKPAPN